MVLLGGMGSILGPVVGAFLLTGLPHIIEFSAELRAATYGAILILVILADAARYRRDCSRVGAMFLEVDALTKRFGGLVAVSAVSLDIEEGEIVGILGPNGSGKTTLLNLLAGLLAPSSGKILWQGRDISGTKPDLIAALGIVKTFQNPQLFAELSVLEHVMIAGHLALKRLLGFARSKTIFAPKPARQELRRGPSACCGFAGSARKRSGPRPRCPMAKKKCSALRWP